MWRMLFVAALSAAIYTASPAFAQPTSKDNVKKLEAELEKLKTQIKDLEARLQKEKGAQAPAAPWKQFGPWGKMDAEQIKKMIEQYSGKPGGFDPEQIKKMIELFKSMQKEPEKKEAKKDDKAAGPPWARGGNWGGWGRDFRRPTDAPQASDIERRLDRLIREIEDLRRDIKKK